MKTPRYLHAVGLDFTRRTFLRCAGMAAAGAVSGPLAGCSVNRGAASRIDREPKSPLVVYKHEKPYRGKNEYFVAIEPAAEYGKPFCPETCHRVYLRFFELAFFGFMEPSYGAKMKVVNFDFSARGLSYVKCVSNDPQENDKVGITLEYQAVQDGVELLLTVKNTSKDYTWPVLAGLGPCLTPGNTRGEPVNIGVGNSDPPICANFADNDSRYIETANRWFWQFGPQSPSRTYFLGPEGLRELITMRHHFNSLYKERIEHEITDNPRQREGYASFFTMFHPTSDIDVQDGLMIRESQDGWVSAIAGDRQHVLFVQGHNPQKCMHLGLRIGGLQPGSQTQIRGKIYLFKGTKEQCLNRYIKDFDFNSLLAHWPLVSSDRDNSGNEFHGTMKGKARFVENALFLDGDSSYMEIPHCKGVSGGHCRTVTARVKTKSGGDIVCWGADEAGRMWRFWVNDNYGNKQLGANGALAVHIGGGHIVGNIPVTDNKWHHVAAVLPYGCDNVADVRLYADGKLQNSKQLSAIRPHTINTAARTNVTIGVNHYIGIDAGPNWDGRNRQELRYQFEHQYRFFHGSIKDVRIYSRDLRPKEIAHQFSSER